MSEENVYEVLIDLIGDEDLKKMFEEGDSQSFIREMSEFITWTTSKDAQFEKVLEEITDQRRWSTDYRTVYKHKESGRFFERYHEEPSTEMQDGMDLYEEWEEVVPKEVTVIQYVSKY